MLLTTTIASGQSLSAAVDLTALYDKGARLFAIAIPSAWTTANLTFQGSADGTTYCNLYDASGTEVTATVTGASTLIVLDPVVFSSLQFLKIRSGTSGTAVNQGGDRVLQLVLRGI